MFSSHGTSSHLFIMYDNYYNYLYNYNIDIII